MKILLIVLFFWFLAGTQIIQGLKIGVFFDEEPVKMNWKRQAVAIAAIGPVAWTIVLLWPMLGVFRKLWRSLE